MDIQSLPFEIKLRILKDVKYPDKIKEIVPRKENRFWYALCNEFVDEKLKYQHNKNYFDIYTWIYNVTDDRKANVYARDVRYFKYLYLFVCPDDLSNFLQKIAINETKLKDELCKHSDFFAVKLGLKKQIYQEHSVLYDKCKLFVKPKYLKIFEEICHNMPHIHDEFIPKWQPISWNNIDHLLIKYNYEDIQHGDLIVTEDDLFLYSNGRQEPLPPKVLDEFPIHTWRHCVNNKAFEVKLELSEDEKDKVLNTISIQTFERIKIGGFFLTDINLLISEFFRNGLKFHIVSLYLHSVDEDFDDNLGLKCSADSVSWVYPYFYTTRHEPIDHFKKNIKTDHGEFYSVRFDTYDENCKTDYFEENIELEDVDHLTKLLQNELKHLNFNRILLMGNIGALLNYSEDLDTDQSDDD